jgi:hypothetical protein
MAVTPRSKTRTTRRLALGLAFACLLAPLALAASGDPCCAGMVAPCHEDPAPCATLDAATCCDVAPATAPPPAERECQAAQAAFARATSSAAAHAPLPVAPAPAPARVATPLQLSVVLRN